MKKYFITGIGTDVGKTLVSAFLVETLQADYWKPIQTGTIDISDKSTIKDLISNSVSKIHQEAYAFKLPASPHLAAAAEGCQIDINRINLPRCENENLIIEGAGGLLVPITNGIYVVDLAKRFDAEVILVCRNYLGCINHTLLSIDYLRQHNYKLKGVILSGDFEALVRSAILASGVSVLAEIPELSEVESKDILELRKGVSLNLGL